MYFSESRFTVGHFAAAGEIIFARLFCETFSRYHLWRDASVTCPRRVKWFYENTSQHNRTWLKVKTRAI